MKRLALAVALLTFCMSLIPLDTAADSFSS
jgi:hypothetical protein